MKLALRDDDLSYWTSVEEIEALYGKYFETNNCFGKIYTIKRHCAELTQGCH